jgi:hypothetical protein
METDQRLDKLDALADETRQRLLRIEVRLDGMDARMATKEDVANLRGEMHQMETRIIKWFVGTAIALSAGISTIVFAIAKFIH